ncbi:MAG: TonB family protein [Candidatus Desantisbacteria bacterium]
MTKSRTLNRPLIASLSIHMIIALICWFIVIKPPKQIQRLIEVNLIELPQFNVQEQPILPPKIEPIKPKRVRIETKTIIPQTIQVKQNYQEPYRTKQIIEKPIKVDTPRPIFVSPPTDRVRIEEKPEISLPVAHLEAPKEIIREKYPSAIVPSSPLPFLPAKGSSVQIIGMENRRVKHRPMFKLPEWVEEKGISMSGALKFWVSTDGSIDRVEIIKTFGYSEIDSLACSAVYKWRFEELSEEQGEKNDWAIVKFRIQLN